MEVSCMRYKQVESSAQALFLHKAAKEVWQSVGWRGCDKTLSGDRRLAGRSLGFKPVMSLKGAGFLRLFALGHMGEAQFNSSWSHSSGSPCLGGGGGQIGIMGRKGGG
ncbi:hypothetical protein Adt_11425 [Abeliophyllum distichum]|uniref:Uncharacterized protein n=1 Tax=Abeliophyllum distichum TaxID=126358 RepID=A0ABD1UN44_9LAMI